MRYHIDASGIHFEINEPPALVIVAATPEPIPDDEALRTVKRIAAEIEAALMNRRDMIYLPSEHGQGIVEYALILVLVAIVVIAILLILGPQIANIFSRITNGVAGT